MKRVSLILALLMAFVPCASRALGAVGDGFRPPVHAYVALSLAVQPWDGKIVVGGDITENAAPDTDLGLLRFNQDGTIDATFRAKPDSWVTNVLFHPDHSMIILGYFTQVTYVDAQGTTKTVPRNGIARILENGLLDERFDPGASLTGQVGAQALSSDGKSLYVGGEITATDGSGVTGLAKISLDPSSANYGKIDPTYAFVQSVSDTTYQPAVTVMERQEDGRIVIGGWFDTIARAGAPAVTRRCLARLNPDGTVDESFAVGLGFAQYEAAYSLNTQPDGQIVVGGYFASVTSTKGVTRAARNLARFTRTGEVDDSFLPVFEDAVLTTAVQPDGKILVGGIFSTVDGVPRKDVVRLNADGTIDSFNPSTPFDGVIALAVQPDGKIILGGGLIQASDTTIPRYYPDGTLDDDVFRTGVMPDGNALPLALQPDGMLTVGGAFISLGGTADWSHPVATYTGGTPRQFVARLRRDWTLATADQFDPALAPAYPPGHPAEVLALQPDWRMWIGGFFPWIDPESGSAAHRPNLERIDLTGHYDPDPDASGKPFFDNVQALMLDRTGWVYAMAVPPPASQYEGMAYVGGYFIGDWQHKGMSRYHLFRMTAEGKIDASFDPGDLMGTRYGIYAGYEGEIGHVRALALQRDGKLLVGISGPSVEWSSVIDRGVVIRLNPDGTVDEGFAPFYVNHLITVIAVQKDGRILVGGWFTYAVENGATYQQNLVRLRSDGTLDPSFNLETSYWELEWCHDASGIPTSSCFYHAYVEGLALQADGSVVVTGLFNSAKDRRGVPVERDSVLRVGPDGLIDSLNLGRFDSFRPMEKVNSVILQPDGKLVLSGEFRSMAGGTDKRHNLARFANPTAALQALTVSPDGSQVHWLRDGSAPELAAVVFEDSADGVDWQLLGSGTPIEGGWGLAGQDLTRGSNRYLRGRGFAVTSSRDRVLVEEQARYYLKPRLTVRPKSLTKTYGAANPQLELEYVGMEEGDTPASAFTGAVVLSTPVTEATPVGPYDITLDLGTLASAKYYLLTGGGSFTVTKAPLTVTAGSGTRRYGDPEPALSFTATGLKNGDTISVTLTSSATPTSPAGSVQTVTPSAAVFTVGSASNYEEIDYRAGTLAITQRPLTVRADDQYKSAGKENPPLTASYLGLAPGEGREVLGGAPELSTTADINSPADHYPITIAPGTLSSPNYSFTFQDGTMYVVDQMPQTIDFTVRPHVYGDADFLPGAVARPSGLPVSYRSADSNLAEVVVDSGGGQRIRVKSPGVSARSATITASQEGSYQYFPAEVTAELLVHPPPWNGISLDGVDDVVAIPDSDRLDFSAGQSFTVETWLHLAGTQGDGAAIVSKWHEGAGYELVMYQDKIGARIGDGLQSRGPLEGLVGTASLNDGLWHHVALALDRQGSEARLYLDGNLQTSLPLPAGFGAVANDGALLVGGGDGSPHFQGEIDELRLWSAARSRDEIRSVVSQIIDPAAEGTLAAYYHFDEGTARGDNAGVTRPPDRTAYGNDGLLVGLALAGDSSNWTASGAFAPLVETSLLSNAGGGALVAGTLFPNHYPATERGFCWGSDPNPGLSATCASLAPEAAGFQFTITGLAAGTYHVRAYARNAQGLAFGNDVPIPGGRLSQATTFDPLTDRVYGSADFPIGATSGSGLPLTFTSSVPEVAVVIGDKIHITGAGTTVITAKQGGDDSWESAQDVAQTFRVLPAPLTVRADNLSRRYKTQNPPLTASYFGFVLGEGRSVLSGEPLLLTAAAWESNAGNYPITVAAGTLSARNYSFTLVDGTLSITPSGQCISFPLIGERTFGDDPFTIGAAACSGHTVVFESSDPSVIRVDGNSLTVLGAGTVTITARESGDGNFESAEPVSQTVVVHRAGQQVQFSSLAQKVVGDPPFELQARASSGLPVSYQSSDPAVAQISGSTVTITGPGTTVITALQGGDPNYRAANPAYQTLTVAQEGMPPLVLLSTLFSGAITGSGVLNVEGACRDASGIASVTVNGAELSGDRSLFSVAVPLSAGVNTLTVSATDLAGNRTTETRTVVLQGTAPGVSVTAPPDNASVAEAQVVVRGTAQAGSSVAVSVNGSTPQGVALLEGGFSATAILTEGVNTIEVSAEIGGTKSTVKRSVAFSAGKPAVAIADPAQDLMTEAGSVLLQGSAPGAAQLSLRVNDTAYYPALEGGVFRQQIPLDAPGTYRVVATASAPDGSAAVAFRNIIRTPVIRGDVNGDGAVDLYDVVKVLRLSVGMEALTEAALSHADVAPLVDGVPRPDGIVDVGDVVVLLRKLVGLANY